VPDRAAPAARPVRDMVIESERTWLGLTAAPLATRLREAGWQPRDPRLLCPRCGQGVGPFEADRTGCPDCRAGRPGWERLVRLGEYEGVWRDVVHDIKFTAWRTLGESAGKMLGAAIREAAAHDPAARGRSIVLVPVPTTFRRRLARGIDHTQIIAQAAARAGGVRWADLLARETRPSQVGLSPRQRASNVRGSMFARRWGGPLWWWRARQIRRADAGPLLLVLVDDVKTTGATLREAARALRESMPEIAAEAVQAHPPREARPPRLAQSPTHPPTAPTSSLGPGEHEAARTPTPTGAEPRSRSIDQAAAGPADRRGPAPAAPKGPTATPISDTVTGSARSVGAGSAARVVIWAAVLAVTPNPARKIMIQREDESWDE
jgi:predicted amidophosphoribosyltransferase